MTEEQIQEAIEAATAEALALLLTSASPPIQHVLQFFSFAHLPPHLRGVSCDFAKLAGEVATRSSNAETTVALRKLLEAKDAAVRALIAK